jgi:hypothetical protein
MPNKQRKQKGRRSTKGRGLAGVRGRSDYQEVIKVSGTVTVTASTTGNTFQGITGPFAGGGSLFTPYANGTNYATLSQWGDFRSSRIVVRPVATVVGSTADSVNVIAALDSTGQDAINGGTATGAWNSIRSRQTSRTCYLSNARPQGPKWSFKPVELNNRLWFNQSAFSASSYATAGLAVGQFWGVIISAYSATSSTVTLEIDWYFDVREPQLSGVLLGTETDEVRKRMERLVAQQCPWASGKAALPSPIRADPDDDEDSIRQVIRDIRSKSVPRACTGK